MISKDLCNRENYTIKCLFVRQHITLHDKTHCISQTQKSLGKYKTNVINAKSMHRIKKEIKYFLTRKGACQCEKNISKNNIKLTQRNLICVHNYSVFTK